MKFRLAIVVALSASAAAADPLSPENAFKPPSFQSMRLSPDGKHIAAIGRANGATALLIIDSETLGAKHVAGPARALTAPASAHWITDRILAVNSRFGADLIDTTGKQLSSLGVRYIRNVKPDSNGHERLLAALRPARPSWIERVDIRTGERAVTNFEMPGDPISWIFDDDGVARAVTTMSTALWTDDTTITHWYRATEQDHWQKLATFAFTDDYWLPLYLTRDGKSLVVWSSQGRDTRAYFRYDLTERRIAEMMAGHPTQDVFAHRSDSDENYDRVVTEGMKPEIQWFDARFATLQRAVDAAIPDRVNFLSGDAGGKILVYSYGDVDPGHWFLLDTSGMVMKEIAAAKREIDAARMRPMQIVSYPADDGITIPAYLTLPAGAQEHLPTVVLIHGGPIARDHWQFDPDVQLLASRGYAVLQPQFRGSNGFGKRFMRAGYGQWGLAMEDDIASGVRWLIEKHIADPDRVCIYGASYGGYAALWGLIKTPELYRCGISLAGVSDIEFMFSDDSDVNDSALGRLLRRSTIGDLKTHKQQFNEVSPLKKAAQIKAPVLIAHGTKDRRVPIGHSEKLVAALKENGKEFEWIELEGEGHGIARDKNRQRFYRELFRFLEKHIGPAAPMTGKQ